jgi:hypothetical protein
MGIYAELEIASVGMSQFLERPDPDHFQIVRGFGTAKRHSFDLSSGFRLQHAGLVRFEERMRRLPETAT